MQFEILTGSFSSGMDSGEADAKNIKADFSDRDSDLDVLWDRFQNSFSSHARQLLLDDFTGPEEFFGLNHDNVVKHLRQKLQNKQS